MVAHLVRLKLALLRNGLRRSPAALVGLAVGVLYGSGLLALAIGGMVALRLQPDLDLARAVTTLLGAALVVAWAVVPVLVFGTDPTLDPARFATFAVPERHLAVGLALSGLVGLPGIATTLLVLSTGVTWSRTPASLLAALVGGAAALATCVLLSRILTAAASAVLSTRRGRDVLAAAGFVAVLAIAPAVSVLSGREIGPDDLAWLTTLVGWSPVGWAWAAPADLAQGQWLPGLVRLLLALLLAAGLLRLWQRQIAAAVRNPRGGAAASDAGGHAGLGLFERVPGTPLGAVAARSLLYWRRDPRLNFPALITVLLPAGLLVPGLGGSELALLAMPLASAYMFGWGQHNDVGYDSTAFWMHVAAGVDGVSDRVGRLVPSAVLAAVCIPAYAVLGAALSDRWDLLPAVLGVAAALLLCGFALAAVTSAVKQYPVPGPGESPFATPPGGAGITLLVQTVVGLGVLVLSLPALVLGALAWFGHGWAAWAALLVGAGLGAVAMVVGVRLGARLFERRGPELLQDLVRTR